MIRYQSFKKKLNDSVLFINSFFQLKKHVDQAIKEKENIVIKFATKEKYLLDAKKEKETFEKLLNDSKKEIKNLTTKYQTLNDEKSRLLNIIDEKVK